MRKDNKNKTLGRNEWFANGWTRSADNQSQADVRLGAVMVPSPHASASAWHPAADPTHAQTGSASAGSRPRLATGSRHGERCFRHWLALSRAFFFVLNILFFLRLDSVWFFFLHKAIVPLTSVSSINMSCRCRTCWWIMPMGVLN